MELIKFFLLLPECVDVIDQLFFGKLMIDTPVSLSEVLIRAILSSVRVLISLPCSEPSSLDQFFLRIDNAIFPLFIVKLPL